jgi:hypothetical protein
VPRTRPRQLAFTFTTAGYNLALAQASGAPLMSPIRA